MVQHLVEEISEGVATLTFNRPDRLNALSTPTMEGLLEALPRLARDAGVGGNSSHRRRSRILRPRRRQKHGRGISRAKGGTSRDPFARQNGGLAAFVRNSEADDCDGERTRGGSWTVARTSLRSSCSRTIGALDHRFGEYRIFWRLWRQLLSL